MLKQLETRAAEAGGQGGILPHKTQGVVTMTHNTVAQHAHLLHHSVQHNRAGKTVILFLDIPPACGSVYSHNYVIRL